ncbi:MAG: ATP-binding protein [Erysipelotrichaceae bacterium]|nr:ATP-binding protein [Erysipelotrichaceae bacterium]
MEEIKVFKRKIYDALLEWKDSPIQNSALLIEGARRIGKSTIVEEFAKNEFGDNYLMIDFRKADEGLKELFKKIGDIDVFFQKLFLYQNKVLKSGGLIIFDEIQFCPKARECIKDFVADGRFRYIETGSLISLKENTQGIMIPSEERRIDMYPMDFEEYLWAAESNDSFSLIKGFIDRKEPIPQGIHEHYLEAFRSYMILGGMPKVLSIFLQTSSYKLANDEKLDILKLYRDDLRKHDDKHGTVCGPIFDSIPTQLAQAKRRFVLSSVPGTKRYYQIAKSLSDLEDFRIVQRINAISSLESPIALHAEEDRFKLYFCDTGLLFSMLVKVSNTKMNSTFFDFIVGKKVLNMGALFESIVAQELATNGHKLYYHPYILLDKATGKKKAYELDIVTEIDFRVFVIEVKSSKNYTTSSLDHIKAKYPQIKTSRYVFGIKNASFGADKTTLPVYLLSFL